jgi:ABC-type multidrug transport system fused ATPase/permease subunit
VLLAYIRAAYTPLETISSTVNTIQEQLIGFEMSLELLDTAPDVDEKPDAVALDPVRGDVVYEDVSFAYQGREHTLDRVSFHVEAGESVAVVGRTGAGKSTLVSLLPRFYDPAGGRILLDGVDIRDLTLESLRSQISLVLQEPLLFSGTIADNIRYGRLDATDEEVRAAAKAATPTSSSPSSRSGTAPSSVSAVRSSPAASASASAWRGRSSRTRPSSSWTSRPRRSTPGPRRSSSRRSAASWRAAPPS